MLGLQQEYAPEAFMTLPRGKGNPPFTQEALATVFKPGNECVFRGTEDGDAAMCHIKDKQKGSKLLDKFKGTGVGCDI